MRQAEFRKARSEMSYRRPRRKAGFTFVELIIVVLILGIITMMAMPAMNDFFSDETINAAADAVVSAVYCARVMAITTGVDHRVNFNADTDSFQVEMCAGGSPGEETFVPVENPLTERDYVVSFSEEATGLAGIDLYAAAFGTSEYVRFDSLGNPEAPGQIVIEYGGRERTIAVTATSCEVAA